MRNQRPKASQESPAARTWRIRAAQQRTPTHRQCVVTLRPVYVAGREAMVNVCGVAVARLQEHSWAPTLLNGQKVNVGTVLLVPHRPAACWPVRKGPLPADTDRMGRRTRSSPRSGKPVTWRRGPARLSARSLPDTISISPTVAEVQPIPSSVSLFQINQNLKFPPRPGYKAAYGRLDTVGCGSGVFVFPDAYYRPACLGKQCVGCTVAFYVGVEFSAPPARVGFG